MIALAAVHVIAEQRKTPAGSIHYIRCTCGETYHHKWDAPAPVQFAGHIAGLVQAGQLANQEAMF